MAAHADKRFVPPQPTLQNGLLVLALAIVPAPASSQDTAFWKHLTPGTTLPRCAESSIAFKDAGARLFLFDEYLASLASSSAPAAAIEELHSLLQSECFLPAAETDRIPRPDSIPALKRWWNDGGFSWLHSYLELPRLGVLPNLQPYIVTPPDARATLTPDGVQNNPLRPLICPLDDATCGIETLGWIRRAELMFDAHRAWRKESFGVFGDDPSSPLPGPEQVSEYCAKGLPQGTNAVRYGAWRDCVELRRPLTSALPLGRIRAPGGGWLIISGRRGHYTFCDTTSAYDIATGAAFVHESCSALKLNPGGDVDRETTNSRRTDSIRTGVLPTENLREALWMMLLQEQTKRLQIRSESYPLPEGVIPETVAHLGNDTMWFDAVSWSSAQTLLTWRWIPPTGPAVSFEATWPSSFDGAEDHAAALLDIAELALVPGCVPQGPPAESVIGRPPMRVNPVDAPPDANFGERVVAAYKAWAAAPRCR